MACGSASAPVEIGSDRGLDSDQWFPGGGRIAIDACDSSSGAARIHVSSGTGPGSGGTGSISFGGYNCSKSDFNHDGEVNDEDFVQFVVGDNILDCLDVPMPQGSPADVNSDGIANDAGFVLFVQAYDELIRP